MRFLSKKKNKGAGFTLVEVLIYISVLTLIVSVTISFFLWISKSSNKTKAARETLDNARRVMEIMTNEVRESNGIYSPTSAFGITNSQLSLETVKYLPEDESASYIDFFICEQRLCLKKEGQDPIALTSDMVEIEDFKIYQIATTSTIPSIQINLKVKYKSPSSKPEHQFSINTTSTISLRSY